MITRDHSQHHGVNRPDNCLATALVGLERLRHIVDRQGTTPDLIHNERRGDPRLFADQYYRGGNDIILQ